MHYHAIWQAFWHWGALPLLRLWLGLAATHKPSLLTKKVYSSLSRTPVIGHLHNLLRFSWRQWTLPEYMRGLAAAQSMPHDCVDVRPTGAIYKDLFSFFINEKGFRVQSHE